MDLNNYKQIVKHVLTEYAEIPYSYSDIKSHVIIDPEAKHFLLMTIGWQRHKRIHGCLVHIEIINDKLWIQRDGTEQGIATDLLAAGVPKEAIVLGFHPPEVRPHTEFAAA